MRHFILTAMVILLSPFLVFGQEGFNLQDAWSGQYFKFAPKVHRSFEALPGTNDFVATSFRFDSLHRVSSKKGITHLLSVQELSKFIGEDVQILRGLNWIDEHTFDINLQNKLYRVDLANKDATLLFRIPDDAENVDYNPAKQLAAYTKGNALFIASSEDARLSVADHPDRVSGQSIARSEFGITKGTFWSPSGEKLAYYQKDESEVSDYPLLDITSTPGKLETIKYPMAGQGSERAFAAVYNAENGRTIELKVTGPKDQYITNLSWGPEGKYVYLAIVNREQNHLWFNQYDAETGAFMKTLFEEEHPKYVEPEHAAWFMPGTADEFIWMSDRDGFVQLYRYNTDGELLAQVTSGPYEVEGILGMGRGGKSIIYKVFSEDGLNHAIKSADLSGNAQTVISKNPGRYDVALSEDGNTLLYQWSNGTTPGVMEIGDVRGRRNRILYQAEDPYDGYSLGKTELVSIKAADDSTLLNGRIIKPFDFDPSKQYPVLVYVYGGPHAQLITNGWMYGASLWMHYLANKGYIVFTLDNRGSAHRGRDFENVIHRQLGTIEMADQLKGVEYLKTLDYIDPDRMAVHGWSFGGFMTTSLMLRHPNVFKVGVAGGPVTDWKYYEVMYGERYMDTPEENPKGYETASLLNYADQLQGQLLLIHGTVDDVVVMQHNFSLVQKFVEAGKLIDFMPYPMHKHNVRGPDRMHLIAKIIDYVERNL